jgi:hypothetical protein
MAYLRKPTWLFLVGLMIFAHVSAEAASPDFNADRRVNVKCPSTIARDFKGQFEMDGFMYTLKRLYKELDNNLKAATKNEGDGYAFSADPNDGIFFICHAKATFPAGTLNSLFPQHDIGFRQVFYITDIDWNTQQIRVVRQQDKQPFTLTAPDFERAFLWYNAILDKLRAFIPVYGFLSLPGDASDFPTIWNSWEGHKSDTATPPESLVDYDFYKILDYQDGYYLLGKDVNELDYRDNIEDFGIIGWVQKKFITLWRSRLYYHPMKTAEFFNDADGLVAARETEEINRFYVDHVYLKERLFSDIVERLDQGSLHQFYSQFGFPQLSHPKPTAIGTSAQVFVPGAFTPRLMRLLGSAIKRNLNTFFLLDVSESMRPFADYIKTFNKSVREMRQSGIGLRTNRVYAYWDSLKSFGDASAEPNFIRVKRPGTLTFGPESGDRNYREPLLRALNRAIGEIEQLQKQSVILPLHEKLLFVITDAGANDATDQALEQAAARARALNLNVYFVYPSRHGVRKASATLTDTPDDAYLDLEDLISRFEARNAEGDGLVFRKFKFDAQALASASQRKESFQAHQRRLLEGIRTYLDHVFKATGPTVLPKDVVLYFSDTKLLSEMRKWSNRKIQVLNHIVKFIHRVDDPGAWEERIAIPAKPVEAFIRAIRTQDDISLADLKKLVIINSLVSVDEIDKCRALYDHIKPLIEKKTSRTADDVFYRALTSRDPGANTQWNRALVDDKELLGEHLSKRGFHLNSFNQAVQRKFMYLKVDDLYNQQ